MQKREEVREAASGLSGEGGVLLIVPPFAGATRPSLGVSQLKANIEARGLRAEVLYLNLLFAKRIGLDLYQHISYYAFAPMCGELVFSQVLFGRGEDALDAYVASPELSKLITDVYGDEPPKSRFPDGEVIVGLRPILGRLVDEARDFCQGEAVREILARDPWMIGLTSSFEQNCPSLAVIGEIKAQRPDIVAVMGGANCQGEMGQELFASFATLDFVGLGDCDHSFVDLALSLRDGKSGAGIPGILARGAEYAGDSKMLLGPQLDELPHPDFSDYFATLASSEAFERVNPTLLMETARGCWWGAKQHCKFCGLNGEAMSFRSKTPERALEELTALVERYGVRQMEVVDNILDMSYFGSVLPGLAENPVAEIFWESKANLKRQHVRLLARAGIRWLQPGLESLSDQSLQLMRKGSTALQNVQLLKWCAEDGVHVTWGHLFGFPGEDEAEIDSIARDMEALHHYTAPTHAIPIQIQRFSPYFDQAAEFGLAPIYPLEAYNYVYSLPDESVRRIAYAFDSDAMVVKRKSTAFATLGRAAAEWSAAFWYSHLLAVSRGRSLFLIDTRDCATRFLRRLEGLQRGVYEYCDERQSERALIEAFADQASADEVRATLASLVRDRLMLERDGRYLSLATQLSDDYRAFYELYPSGSITPEPDTGPGRSLVRDLFSLKIPPGDIARGVARRLSGARRVAKTKLAVRLGRMLADDLAVGPSAQIRG